MLKESQERIRLKIQQTLLNRGFMFVITCLKLNVAKVTRKNWFEDTTNITVFWQLLDCSLMLKEETEGIRLNIQRNSLYSGFIVLITKWNFMLQEPLERIHRKMQLI